MKNQLLVTAIGEDRPGIVARLTEVFVKHDANLEESRMAILGGEFAAIILITVDSEKISGLKEDLATLQGDTITVFTKPTKAFGSDKYLSHRRCHLDLSGADHEGIVHRVAQYLRENHVNIQLMDTKLEHAPETGTPLFQMTATILVPPTLSQSELQDELNIIGSREGVDITVTQEREIAFTKH